MQRKRHLLLGIVILLLFLISCNRGKQVEKTKKALSNESLQVKEVEDNFTQRGSSGVWIAYWDLENTIEEATMIYNSYDSIALFAAYFDSSNQLFLPEELKGIREKLKNQLPDKNVYLTIVNDFLLSEGGSSLKDKELLKSVLANGDKADELCNQIIAIAQEVECDGIELDFEKVWNDTEFMDMYYDFVNKLKSKTEKPIRVLLEPSTPVSSLRFPSDIEYGVMCYNLHYTDADPGPKCDIQFLRDMIQKFQNTDNTMTFALATGGFDFGDGKTVSITERQAKELSMRYQCTPVRDEASKSLMFSYIVDGKEHEVWYADQETLNEWKNTIQSEGDDSVWIWRLGGNDF